MRRPPTSPVLVTISPAKSDRAVRLAIPAGPENLFLRVTRRSALGDVPRERAAAEVLCALLQHAPVLRTEIVKELARRAPLTIPPDLERLEWHVATEQSVEGKRDDLRLEAWRDEHLELLWTCELKVYAPFHESKDTSAEDGSGRTVVQLVNYDRWLEKQAAVHKAGFVIGVTDLRSEVTAVVAANHLRHSWTAFTWTELAFFVEAKAESGRLCEVERFLARHFAGFVRNGLWNEELNVSEKIDFDDVALLRAFRAYGKPLFRKLSDAFGQVPALIEQHELGVEKVQFNEGLYTGSMRMAAYRLLTPRSSTTTPPALFAGLDLSRGSFAVWVETQPGHPRKADIRAALDTCRRKMPSRTPPWEMVDEGWLDLSRGRPLEDLLTASDPSVFVRDFIGESLRDLKDAGAGEAVSVALR